MNFLLLQTFLLLLASYFLGAFLACAIKRSFFAGRDAVPAVATAQAHFEPPAPVRSKNALPQTPRSRTVPPPVAPRPIDLVQPRIEVLRRPEPRPAPKLVDPSRFERALMGPDPNEGMPRKPVLEIRPAILKSPTGPARPLPKPAPSKAQPLPPTKTEPSPPPKIAPAPSNPDVAPPPVRTGGPTDATTAAAAAAVAAAKAAAAAASTGAIASRAEPKIVAPPPVETTKLLAPEDDDIPVASDAEDPPPPPPSPPPVERKRIETGDDFQRIRAIDDSVEQDLKTLGITYFEDIAAWTADDIQRIDQTLRLKGRADREQWIEQAQILAKGGETYYSRNRPGARKSKDVVSEVKDIDPPKGPEAVAAAAAAATQDPGPSELSPPLPARPADGAAGTHSPAPATSPAYEGRSVAEMAAAAAAAVAAASASVTRGLRPIEPISPLSKVDPKISIPARLSDAIKEKESPSKPAGDVADASAMAGKTDVSSPKPGNDLKRIRGVGVLIEKRLNAMGINSYDQIANWTSGDIDRVSQVLEFKGRIEREGWVEQARILSSGAQTEFSRRVDRGEVDTSRET